MVLHSVSCLYTALSSDERYAHVVLQHLLNLVVHRF